jgi:alpha-amylase
MPAPTKASDIDLTPIPGKQYFNLDREWREEFIYFLMVDRFQDDQARSPVLQPGRSNGVSTPEDFYGGKIKGIAKHLDYIAGLGCTAIWLSPIFANNPKGYHGYDIYNYVSVDPDFGTERDLIDLVEAAHNFTLGGEPYPIRIILDVVINNSGDNWEYQGGPKSYNNGQQYVFGNWRTNLPIPEELRDPDWYHRRGSIHNYDIAPENQLGDIATLKDYENEDDAIGSAVVNTLIKAYAYWIRNADVDGFRVDAVKHIGPLACSRFCSNIREYAYSLGKRGFFLYGEVARADDDLYNRYIGQNTSAQDGNNTVFFGLDSVLDFRLAEGAGGGGLRDVIKGFVGPQTLFDRLEAQRQRALNRGEIGRYLVTFVDNHDSFWQNPQGRFANGAPDEQVIAAIGYLLCALGTACIYYGTEQGFSGHGGDNQMREAMFDLATPGRNLLNTGCTIYREIAKIANVMRTNEPLRFGRMYFRQISGDGVHFGFPYGSTYTLAFSRILYPDEVLVAYNVQNANRQDYVIVDAVLHADGSLMRYLYGGVGTVPVQTSPDGSRFVKLDLGAHQFAILV